MLLLLFSQVFYRAIFLFISAGHNKSMGFQITMGAWFYIIVMVLVIAIGIAIVAGVTPWKIFNQIGQVFEPGKLYITNDNPGEGGLEKFTKLDCTPNAQLVILDGLKFFYRAYPGSQSDRLDFVVIMDYMGISGTQSKLILGSYSDTNGNTQEIISCAAPSGEFICPQDLKLKFDMRQIGSLRDREVFHFTTWLDKPGLTDDIDSSTLRQMLESNPDAYLSSFDVPVDRDEECGIDTCRRHAAESDCTSTASCYWGGPWYWPWANSCLVCEQFTECGRFGRGACTQCEAARNLGCQPTLTGCA